MPISSLPEPDTVRYRVGAAFTALALALLLSACSRSEAPLPATAADLVLANANVVTVDPALPAAQAVAISGDLILAVGSTDELATLVDTLGESTVGVAPLPAGASRISTRNISPSSIARSTGTPPAVSSTKRPMLSDRWSASTISMR